MRFALAAIFFLSGLAEAGETVPAAERIAARDFPSVFQAWNPAEHLTGESAVQTEARHDLIFHAADFFGLRWEGQPLGLATRFTAESLAAGKQRRAELLEKNPHLILLCEIRYRDAPRDFLPADSPWWKRDAKGQPAVGWEEGDYLLLDYAGEAYRHHLAAQARAAIESGVFDGVFLDWWDEDDSRVALAREVREAIGPDALILVNANERISPRTASLINGHFMECDRSAGPEDWKRIGESLDWAEKHLRAPHINCLETWYADSRRDLNRMRATTTLALTHCDGYALFSDPNPLPTPDHLHDWYPFWDAKLGKPLAAGEVRPDGATIRAFEKGWAVYNPAGNAQATLELAVDCRRVSTGETGRHFQVEPLDGEIFLKVEP